MSSPFYPQTATPTLPVPHQAGLWRPDGGAVPLRGVRVQGKIYGGHAYVQVTQRYQHTEATPVEAVYTFPLPSDATLLGFAMVCNGRRLDGMVKERDEAFRHYDEAVFAGHGAALLEQERANVFTASVGNLLPGEETLIEVQYVQRLQAEEGALRWMLPTLVAPRYIPGIPVGDRTGDGWAEPTDRVPDADRITPPLGTVDYGLTLELLFDLGHDITVDSPSHHVTVVPEAARRQRVTFTSPEVALDRDVVLIARGVSEAPLSSAVVHRPTDDGESGVLALTVVPDLAASAAELPPQNILLLVDVSGSMAGASLGEARSALRLCLRHLRHGDRFNVIAFQSTYSLFAPQPVPFSQQTLDQADAWVAGLHADGGTELLAPLLEAVRQVPDGVVVLLTDGQVGNEDEILREVCATRGAARLYAFGIGSNVSDALLRDLAQHTGGAVEFIYPGERLDDKVVAQFSRALAPRISDVTITFSGSDLAVREQAPATLPALVDGEPWTLFARVTGRGHGQAEIRGQRAGAPFALTVPIDLATATERPLLLKLWAAAWVRELEAAEVKGRRVKQMQQRIVDLAVRYGVMSRYTAFLVIEQRTGARQTSGQPATRVIPVNVPAGWAMFERPRQPVHMARRLTAAALPSLLAGAHNAGAAAPTAIEARYQGTPGMTGAWSPLPPSDSRGEGAPVPGADRLPQALFQQARAGSTEPTESHSPVVALLGRQLAFGLWDDRTGQAPDEVRRARTTATALLTLYQAGVSTRHPVHGAQVKKAVEALLALVPPLAVSHGPVAALSLGAAWLVATGRLRRSIETLAAGTASLRALSVPFGSETAVLAYVESGVGSAAPER